jgi:hypothetical protein
MVVHGFGQVGPVEGPDGSQRSGGVDPLHSTTLPEKLSTTTSELTKNQMPGLPSGLSSSIVQASALLGIKT